MTNPECGIRDAESGPRNPDSSPAGRVVGREEMRAIDRWAIETVGIPSIVLMENAGRGVAAVVREQLRGAGDVRIVCGPGNNGGDGFVAARHLANAGCAVSLVLAGREADFDRTGDAGTHYRVARALGLPCRSVADGDALRGLLRGAACVVDALFGTGLSRPVEGFRRDLIEAMGDAGAEVVAVDIPSGLDADAGRPLGAAVRAAVTATMAFPKRGFFAGEGPARCGEIRVVDIGIPRSVPGWDGSRLLTGATGRAISRTGSSFGRGAG